MGAFAEDSVGSKEPKIPSAVDSDSNDPDFPVISEPSAASSPARGPYSGDLDGVSWNCRSLWANENGDTIKFIEQLLSVHDFVILHETRENAERLAFLKQTLPKGISIFSSGISQAKGGIAILVKDEFLKRFTSHHWDKLEEGRIGRLRLHGRQGQLHIYAVYLDPNSNQAQATLVNLLPAALQEDAHNLIGGDFNFTMGYGDRICKDTAQTGGDNAKDKARQRQWKAAMIGKHLQEFEQYNYTCENSHGWSRIDRFYTSIHPAILARPRPPAVRASIFPDISRIMRH